MREAHFNPRAPCGARPTNKAGSAIYATISIHAPHTGRDTKLAYKYKKKD